MRTPIPLDGGLNEALGFVIEESGPELARGRFDVTDAVRQPFGIVHGGAFCAIAETLASRATAEAVAADGMLAMGQSNQASFMRPISSGRAHAVARRRHGGRTSWVWDVEITDDEERLCALVRMTIAVRPAPGRNDELSEWEPPGRP